MTPEELGAQIVAELSVGIEAEMKRSMQGVKSGRAYQRGGRVHISSAPGESPAVDSGTLFQSITSSSSGLRGKVKVGAGYAGFLDEGTSRMEPRPFVDDAIEKAFNKL